MIIAVNTRILSGDTTVRKILLKIFSAMASENPSHQFYFISETEFAEKATLSNIHHIVIKQQSSRPLLWKLWYNYKLPSLLRKIKADVLFSADGICSLRTKLPQCLLVNDLEFINHPEWYSKKYVSFAKTTLPASLSKAKLIVAFSQHIKNNIISQYKTNAEKIEVIAIEPDKIYKPLSWDKSEAIKSDYTNGNEYFLYRGPIDEKNNLTNLLKAFSLFKKRQKSSMQLLIVTDIIPEKNNFIVSLRLYKYRNDVKILSINNEKEIRQLVAAAWCCINLSSLYADIYFLQNALQCEVPVIAGDNEQAHEIFGKAALYAKSYSVTGIAEQMMQVYKDENKRNELVQAWKNFPEKGNNSIGMNVWWQHIVAIAQK